MPQARFIEQANDFLERIKGHFNDVAINPLLAAV